MKDGNLPKASIIIPCRNEEKFIGKCLDSILTNDYPHDKLEILVIDGMSKDNCRDVVRQYTTKYPFIRLLDNRKGIIPTALNIGIQKSRGDIVIRMDAHAIYDTDYIRQCVHLLQTTEAKNVGGVQQAVGTNYISEVIAIATTTPFGIGNAYYRYGDKECWVETVYLGAWWKSTLEKLGGFNEEWVVNQDYELNYRLRKAGGKILLSPKIRCQYFVRDSLAKLVKQYFRYGFWKVKTLVAHPDSLVIRQLVPPLFVVVFFVSLGLLPIVGFWGLVIPGLYAVANIGASVITAVRRGFRYFPLLPVVFGILHFSWGIGFICGLFKFGVPRIRLKHLITAFKGQK